MLNLFLTIAIQTMSPQSCAAAIDGARVVVPCVCAYTADSLDRRVCSSDFVPENTELKEVE